MSLALLGTRVAGIDISDRVAARELSRKSGVPVGFERADPHDWSKTQDAGRTLECRLRLLRGRCWLSDLSIMERNSSRHNAHKS